MKFDEWINKYHPDVKDEEIKLKMFHSWVAGQANMSMEMFDDFFDRWWININDQLPEEEGYYWVHTEDSPHPLLNQHTVLFKDNKFISAFGITHWRPLPLSPFKK